MLHDACSEWNYLTKKLCNCVVWLDTNECASFKNYNMVEIMVYGIARTELSQILGHAEELSRDFCSFLCLFFSVRDKLTFAAMRVLNHLQGL